MKNKCNCYHTQPKRKCTYHPLTGWPILHDIEVGVCWGTKETDECNCGGDETKCDFYPQVRENAIQTSKEKNWHEIFNNFLALLTATTNGKQQYFEQDDGKWYSRISGKYLTTDEMIAEYLTDIKSFIE